MYPIVSQKKIEATDLYTHFLTECVPIKNSTSAAGFTLIDNGTVKTKTVTLPISINSANNEIWKIDIYLYGLAIKDPSSSITVNTEAPRIINLYLNRNGQNSDIELLGGGAATPTTGFTSTGSGSSHHYGPLTMRHCCCIISFLERRQCWHVVSGQVNGTKDTVQSQGSGGFQSSPQFPAGTYTKITISGNSSVAAIKYAYISGLYLEFTRLSPTNPTNGYNSVIL